MIRDWSDQVAVWATPRVRLNLPLQQFSSQRRRASDHSLSANEQRERERVGLALAGNTGSCQQSSQAIRS